MEILVTGASGHLGYHLCKGLVARGHRVRAMVRRSSYIDHLRELDVELRYGDVMDLVSFKEAMVGVDAVFHAAAVYKIAAKDEAAGESKGGAGTVIDTAVLGTEFLFKAARECGVGKVVYTSSVATVGTGKDKAHPLDESSAVGEGGGEGVSFDYYVAKIESEKLAVKLSKEYSIETIICNPSAIVGGMDFKPTPSNNMLLDMAKKSRFYVAGGQCIVHVEDVAEGHMLALEKGKPGERYILGGDNVELKALFLMIRKALGISGPFIKLPKPLLYAAAIAFEILQKLTGLTPPFTCKKVKKSVGSYNFFDSSKAKRELGYAPKHLPDFLPQTLEWLRERYG